MRDCLFLVADGTMKAMLQGFFGRNNFHLSLGCSLFSISDADIVPAVTLNDPGLYIRARDLLKVYTGRYRHAVVIVDADWEGAPSAQVIGKALEDHLEAAGWPTPKGCAIVIVPELENWLWTDSPHAVKELGWESYPELQAALSAQGFWPAGATKPPRPKEAVQWALRQKRKIFSSAIHKQVAGKVSLVRCTDPAMNTLCATLRSWYP